MLKAPKFWQDTTSKLASCLIPFAWIYATIGHIRYQLQKPYKSDATVYCIGNVTMGGAGKTPVALALAEHLQQQGQAPWFVSRGYGGKLNGPIQVDPEVHEVKHVGDEPLLLAKLAPTVIAKDRRAGVRFAEQQGAKVIILDDGLQNNTVAKDHSWLVIDGGYGIGNGQIFPAGPLREPFECAIKRVEKVVLVGTDVHNISKRFLDKEVVNARIVPDSNVIETLKGKPLLAFCGIGIPEKFFAMLQAQGLQVAQTRAFADHHPYSEKELQNLLDDAHAHNYNLVTTSKDLIRIPSHFHSMVTEVPMKIDGI